MPLNNQLNPITGVPQRVGAPVEAIKEVGQQLTQRYWAAKDNVSKISTALANMPIINASVDNPLLQAASQYVDGSFKKVAENDAWYNATDTVMDVSNKLTTDPSLKALQSNVATMQNWEVEYDKGAEKNTGWSQYKDVIKAKALKDYVTQGGSVSKDGKPQQLSVYTPKTNLDLTTDIKDIEDLSSKLEKTAQKLTSSGNQTYITKAQIDLLDDESKAILNPMLSEDIITTEKLTKASLREAAAKHLDNPTFAAKTNEIAMLQHYQNRGTDSIDLKDIKNVIPINSQFEKSLALGLSDTYNATSEILKKQLTDKVITNGQYDVAIKKLMSDPISLEEGRKKLYNLPQEKLQDLYQYGASNILAEKVIATSEAFEINNRTFTRNRFDPHLADLVRDQNKRAFEARYTTDEENSGVINADVTSLNPSSDLFTTYKTLQTAYDNAPAGENKFALGQQLNKAKALYEGTLYSIATTYNNMSAADKEKIHSSTWGIFDAQSQALFTQSKNNRYSLDKIHMYDNKDVYNLPRIHLQNDRENAKIGYVFEHMSPKELLSLTNDQIYNKYSTKFVRTPEYKTLLNKALDKQRFSMSNAISKSTGGNLIAPITVITDYGTPSPAKRLLTKNVVQSAYAGALTLASDFTSPDGKEHPAGTVLTPQLLKDWKVNLTGIDGKEGDIDNMNDAYTYSVQDVNSNGTVVGGGSRKRLSLRTIDGVGQKKVTDNIVFDVMYNGNPKLNKEVGIEAINNSSPLFRKPSSRTTAINDASVRLNNIGEQVMTKSGVPLIKHINAIDLSGNKNIDYNIELDRGYIEIHGHKGNYEVTIRNANKQKVDYFKAPHIRNVITWTGLESSAEQLKPDVYNNMQQALHATTSQEERIQQLNNK